MSARRMCRRGRRGEYREPPAARRRWRLLAARPPPLPEHRHELLARPPREHVRGGAACDRVCAFEPANGREASRDPACSRRPEPEADPPRRPPAHRRPLRERLEHAQDRRARGRVLSYRTARSAREGRHHALPRRLRAAAPAPRRAVPGLREEPARPRCAPLRRLRAPTLAQWRLRVRAAEIQFEGVPAMRGGATRVFGSAKNSLTPRSPRVTVGP